MGAGVVIQADGYLFLSMEKSSLWERSPDLDRIAQDTALPKTPHCPRHRIAQDTALPKTPHCPRHRIAQDTALPKTPHCPRHRRLESFPTRISKMTSKTNRYTVQCGSRLRGTRA
jgi:hypothetical protein